MKTIIVGLGNPVLGDDGVGWRVADHIRQALSGSEVEFSVQVDIICLSLGGLALMEHLIGYDWAILIDAINLGKGKIGHVFKISLQDLPDYTSRHTTSAHDTTLQTALKLGKKMGVDLPKDIEIVGIQTTSVFDFSDELSPEVEASVPIAAEVVSKLLFDNLAYKQTKTTKNNDLTLEA